jgi:putative membrane protein insertion efficiency factor
MLAKFAIFLLQCYKKYISPMLGNNCRFIPSCSEYAMQVYEKFGFIEGSYLAIFRLLRCAPWCKGGYDPIPKNKEEEQEEKQICSPYKSKRR